MQGLTLSMRSAAAALTAWLTVAALAAEPGAAAPDSRPQTASPAALTTERDRISYAVGVQTGRALRTADGAEVDLDALVRGLKDGLDGARLQIPERQMNEMLGKFQQTLRQKMAASRARAIAENRLKAEKFLADNKGKDGVITLASGLQYRILKAGSGRLPQESDVVTVNYRGTLTSGTEFDSSQPGQPARLAVGSLIAGWKEALKLMPVGSHWELYIPPSLGYGERGVGAEIGPNEALVFDVELLDTRLSKAD
jgi:FKBP-type peptidyl-prolyl cis-trans isomerase